MIGIAKPVLSDSKIGVILAGGLASEYILRTSQAINRKAASKKKTAYPSFKMKHRRQKCNRYVI